MKLTIDLEKDAKEDLKMVRDLINIKIPDALCDGILNDNLTKDERIILAVINNLITRVGFTVPMQDIINDSRNLNLDQKKVNNVLESLGRKGQICEIKQGFIRKIV